MALKKYVLNQNCFLSHYLSLNTLHENGLQEKQNLFIYFGIPKYYEPAL